jgi:hypothetical protein
MTDTSGKKYKTNDEICAEHGGNPKACAPIRDGRVLYLRVTPQMNPDAPHVILLSSEKPKVCEAAQILAYQGKPIPIYLKKQKCSKKD